ncbi:voltage-gated potassium channel [Piromyces finnis]|uniref:Voltage-gated potassium channel n=1 Tax=Piromyces finnis TaxID=1754191 RepID=A0A1Y1VFZ9_9FUNG|nr:voltage-gated potassium channel [Piromyces finnis]|eukprot:ORX55279.1 voltage-gated potassium channel [Piromyces finnis]
MTTADINIDSNNKNEQYTQNLYYNGSGSSDLIYGANNNGTSLSISKSREKRMTKLLVVGIILPFSVLFNIQASEIPAWYNKKTKEPLSFPFYIVALRIIGQIAGASATIALFLKSVHIGSSFRILKWRLHKKHRGVIMIVGALIQCLCSIVILIYYYRNYYNYVDGKITSEFNFFTIQSILFSFFSIVLLSKDVKKRKRIFRQSGVKPKNRLSYMQRQLIVLEILGIFYIIIGGILFSKLENWSFNDSIYFTVTTLMTCGSGDYSPASFFGQFALMAYSIPGIALTTYTVYSVYSVISEILYAKVYKDFSRFINSSNDMYFQNLVKNDKSSSNSIINFGDDIPSTSNEQGNNINEEKKWTSPDDKGKIKVLSLPQNNKDSSNVSFNINILEQNKKEPLFFKSKQSILFNESNNAIPVQTLRFDALSNDSYDSSDSSSSSDEDEENPELRHLLSSRSNSYFKQESTISDQLVIPNYNSIQPNLSFIKDDSFRHRSISYQGNDYYSDIDEKSGKKAFMLTRRNTFNINQSSVQGMKLFSTNQNINTEQVLKKTRDLNVRQLKISVTLLVLLILFFSLIYSWIEDWSFFESIYFCFINLCTIGYGDFVPKSVYGKSIYIYFMYSAVSATTWMGTVLLELATGRWEIYIEKTDLEDELFKNDFNKKREEQQEKKKEIEEEEIEEEKQQ